jgi:hypothetical protein
LVVVDCEKLVELVLIVDVTMSLLLYCDIIKSFE